MPVSATLTLAKPEHAERLGSLVAAFHAEEGLQSTEIEQTNGLMPLLEGSPYGMVYLIGPPRAPIGYIAITLGWSIEFGGLDGFVDELYIRPAVRGRAIATEILLELPQMLADQAGLKALHLEVATHNAVAQRLYQRAGFQIREGYHLMTRQF